MERFSIIQGTATVLIAGVATLPPLVGTFARVVEDRSLRALQQKQISLAKGRMELWEMRAAIEEKVLSGPALDDARRKTKLGVDLLWRETNANLERMRLWNSPPPRSGVSGFRRFFLLYWPTGASKGQGIFYRILYLLAAIAFFCFGGILIWSLLTIASHPALGPLAVRLYVDTAILLLLYVVSGRMASALRMQVWRENLSAKPDDLRAI